MKKPQILLTAFLAALALWPWAEAVTAGITISAELTSTAVPFDGKDTLIVKLLWDGDPFLYEIDDFPMPPLEKLQVLGSSSTVASSDDSMAATGRSTMRTFVYVLQPTDFGTGVIAPLHLTATNRTTSEKIDLQTGRLTVEIGKPTAIKPERSGLGFALVVVFVLLVAGAGVIVWVFLHYKKKPKPVVADRRYLEALDEIRKASVADNKLFYSRLYRLLVQYLEKEKKLNLTGRTGEEVMQRLEQLPDEAERRELSAWLDQALKVKFRPETPSAGEVEDCYRAVLRFFESKITGK